MDKSPTKERKKPGRKAETPEQRLARLEQDIILARRAVQEGRQKTLAAIGSAALEEAAEDAKFAERLRQIMQKRVTKKAEQADVLALIGAA